MRYTFFEFFAGGGMARAGLGIDWQCLFANDFDPMKAATYKSNWGDDHFVCRDVAKVKSESLPGTADLVWASFPCQDLSLAGSYKGLGNASSKVMTRSGTFWPFWELMRSLIHDGRAPKAIVLENVTGMLSSRNGQDFAAVCKALDSENYKYGAIVADAKDFVPQSRKRVFFIAIRPDIMIPESLSSKDATSDLHPPALTFAQRKIDTENKSNWIWWNVSKPIKREKVFSDLVEENPIGCDWHDTDQTNKLLEMMSPLHLAKVSQAKQSGKKQVGAVYKRTREESGVKKQRAEVRFDDVAGCLRTPGGGSSRQLILVVEGESIRSRLLSPREAARLMGLDDEYKLPVRYNDAYHVAGDGVCVPVVRYLASNILEPVLIANSDIETLVAAE